MSKKDYLYLGSMMLVAALLMANLLKPTALRAEEPEQEARGGVPHLPPAMISAAGDSAWAIVGNKVYYLSVRPRGDIAASYRTINTIDTKVLE